MIKIKKNRLVISLKDDRPKDLLRELRKAIVVVIQDHFVKPQDGIEDELRYSQFKLMELLKEFLKKPRR